MNVILAITGVISAISFTLAAITIIGLVALTDLHERMMDWICHKIWW